MNKRLFAGVALGALTISGAAFAQSTGSIDFDKEIVVTAGKADKSVGGVSAPDTSKAKAVLSQEFIARQGAGQTVSSIINSLPGVSFQNNDPFGSAGGTLTIRGFDSTRISQTFDGVPLNDSGNYALFSNQQLDPELIEQVNVNLGSTDVDSPTAAATGSTVNYRSRKPLDDLGLTASGSVGEYKFFRIFGVLDTGTFGPWGTKAYITGSHAENDNVFNNRGRINKQQYNAKIYQPIGSSGDFVSVAGHYNQNRNNFFGSVPLRTDNPLTGTATVTVVPNRFPLTKDERFYTVLPCTINQVATAGVANVANTCGSTFDERTNPSNTGNIRVASKFTLMDGLTLAVDPSYQYVKANGGGTVVGQEGLRDVNPVGGTATPNACVGAVAPANSSCQFGYIGGTPYFGRDLNGDGDRLDTVRVIAPSQTQTHRYGVISSLRYDISDSHTVRIAYSYDRARHRQTGQVGFLQANGEPLDVFPVNDGLADVGGNILQKRDRLSYAVLNQFSGEYRGEFFDNKLTATLGLRAPFFKRDLNNFCATSSATGFVECFAGNAAGLAAFTTNNPTVTVGSGASAATIALQGPQQRVLKYDKLLPNIGFTYDVADNTSIFANYSKSVQVPGTDNLYNSFFFLPTSAQARPTPETTDNFDLGVRYRTSKMLVQLTTWYTKYSNRLASAYDPDLDRSVYRNLGTVNKYGIDGSISYQVLPELQFYIYGSYLKSKIKDDLQLTELLNGTAIFAATAGKRESGSPVYSIGGRVQGKLGPLELGAQAKTTGKRYINDTNLPVLTGAAGTQIFAAATPAYTLVDFDIRLPLGSFGGGQKTYFQLNATNVFDKLYVGGFSGGNQSPTFNTTTGAITGYSAPIFVQIGAPRTFMGSFVVTF